MVARKVVHFGAIVNRANDQPHSYNNHGVECGGEFFFQRRTSVVDERETQKRPLLTPMTHYLFFYDFFLRRFVKKEYFMNFDGCSFFEYFVFYSWLYFAGTEFNMSIFHFRPIGVSVFHGLAG